MQRKLGRPLGAPNEEGELVGRRVVFAFLLRGTARPLHDGADAPRRRDARAITRAHAEQPGQDAVHRQRAIVAGVHKRVELNAVRPLDRLRLRLGEFFQGEEVVDVQLHEVGGRHAGRELGEPPSELVLVVGGRKTGPRCH